MLVRFLTVRRTPLDAWIGTILTCLTEKRTRGSHQQKLFADTYRRQFQPRVEQLAENLRCFGDYWDEGETVSCSQGNVFETGSDCTEWFSLLGCLHCMLSRVCDVLA